MNFQHLSKVPRVARGAMLLAFVLAAVGFTGGATSLAQPAPNAYFNQNLIPPDVPSAVLMGETLTFTVRFKNTGNAIGFGPFVDLALDSRGADANAFALKCDGLDFANAQMVAVNGGPLALTSTKLPAGWNALSNCSTATSTPTHPYAGVGQVTLPASGWQLVTMELPFGSFDPSQPEIVVEVTANVSDYADPGVPLKICARGGFQFGASATGATPILQPLGNVVVDPSGNDLWTCQAVIPAIFMFKKEYAGPENETATGPNFIQKYKLTLDIAAGQTIGKPLTIKDCLPNIMAYEGGLVVTKPTSWPPFTATSPPGATPPTGTVNDPPASCLAVAWPNIMVPGVPGPDATVQFNFSIRDVDADGNEILKDCTPVAIPNDMAVIGQNWSPKDPRDTGGTVSGNSPNAHVLSAKCMAIQKSVTPTAGVKPGDVLKYTLNFQISDYKTIGQIQITDRLSDGQLFLTSSPPVLTIGDQLGGYTISPLSPAHHSATGDPNSQVAKCPVKGTTNLVFDISGALAAIPPTNPRQVAGILTGGYATTPTSTAPAVGTLVFYAQVSDDFVNAQSPGDKYVDKDDPLCNEVEIQGTVYKNEANAHTVPAPLTGTTGPQVAKDGSASQISVASDVLKKSVYAVKRNNSWVCGPSPLSTSPCTSGQQVFPGDLVTFRIEYNIPSGDAENLTITDWLPLPVFDVNDADALPSTTIPWTFAASCPTAAIPPAGSAGCGPTNTVPVPVQFPLPAVAPQSGNSIQFTYGPSIFNTSNTPKKIDLLFTLTVTNTPFADQVQLTSEAQECEQNTFGTTFCQTAIAQVQVREPVLNIRKGVIATDDPYGQFSQAASPQTSPPTAQAPPGVTFSLAGFSGSPINSTNLGNLFDSDLTNVDANDLATFAIVIENKGGYPAFNVHLDDFIPWDKSQGLPTCFKIVSGSLSIKNGANQVVPAMTGFATNSLGDIANLGITLTNPIPALDAITAVSGANIVVITFQVKLLANIKAGCCENSAKLALYTSGPNPNLPNFVDAGVGGPFDDTAKICVGPRAFAKCIQATSEAHTTPQQAAQGGQVPAAIGEIVRFRLVTVIPEGTTQGFQIADALPVGLTYIPGSAKATFVANSPVTNPVGIPTVIPPHGGAQCPGAPTPSVAIPFGTGTNFPAAPITIVNNDNDPDLEYLVIEFNAQVDNIASNQDLPATVLPNSFGVKFTDATTGQTVVSNSAAVNVKIVEPKLTLTKTAKPTSVVQGGTVIYLVTINNTGTATAFDVAFKDTLPNGFTAGTVSFLTVPTGCTSNVSGLGVTCLSPGFGGIPVNGVMTIQYKAVANPQACPVTLQNQATATWTSLPGPNGTVVNATGSSTVGPSGANNGERNGVTPPLSLNDYNVAGSAAVNCVQHPYELVVGKAYDHPPGMSVPSGAVFYFTVDCHDPANPSAAHLVQIGTITSPQTAAASLTTFNPPVGWICTATETVPSTVVNGCFWAPGIPITPNPFTIQTPPLWNGVTFKNNFVCAKNPNYDLSINKASLSLGSSGPNKGFVITVQNVGNSSLSAADLSHLKVTDNLPGGSIVTGYGNTSTADWSCPAAPTAAPVTCSYVGPNPVGPFAALPQLQIFATPGTGTTQYVNPSTGAIVNTNQKLNCAVMSLTGTGTGHDDVNPLNNQICILM